MFKGSVKFFIIIGCFMVISSYLYSQEYQIPVRDERIKKPPGDVTHFVDIGLGFGLDYGGVLGFQVGVAPVKHLTLFAAGGYYLLQIGWQAGIKGLIIPKTTRHVFRPFLKAMFGCNSAITAQGTDEYDKVYMGFTVGAGAELRFGRKKKNGLDFDLNVPLRTSDFWDDFNRMKNDPSLEVLQGPVPIALSIGFHHEF